MITTDELKSLISARDDVLLSRHLAVVAFVICIYDWMLVFSRELELVGKARLCLGKVLYYLSRVITPIGLGFGIYHLTEFRNDLSHTFCVTFTFLIPLMQVFSIMTSYWLLMLRLVALYKKKTVVVWFIYGAFFTSYIATLALLIRAQVFFSHTLVYTPSIGICTATMRAPTIASIFYAPLGFELMLFSLIIYHAWKDYRTQPDSNAVPLLRVLYRDGVLSFIVMVSLRIWNVVIYSCQALTRTWLGVYIMWSAVTILSSRTYLNIAGIARKHNQGGSASYAQSSFQRGEFPRVIGRPLPARTTPVTTIQPTDSEMFYSGYFRDHLALDSLASDSAGAGQMHTLNRM